MKINSYFRLTVYVENVVFDDLHLATHSTDGKRNRVCRTYKIKRSIFMSLVWVYFPMKRNNRRGNVAFRFSQSLTLSHLRKHIERPS